jgi:hypothetical protein
MVGKDQILQQLEEEFSIWQNLLNNLTEKQKTSHPFDGLSIKDKVAHLWAWQQRTIERLEAALQEREPEFPEWPAGLDPESEEDLFQVNNWIFESLGYKPWSKIYTDWKSSFNHVIELAKQIPENDLLDPEKYPWLDGYPLVAVLTGTWEHHHIDHFDQIQEWVQKNTGK